MVVDRSSSNGLFYNAEESDTVLIQKHWHVTAFIMFLHLILCLQQGTQGVLSLSLEESQNKNQYNPVNPRESHFPSLAIFVLQTGCCLLWNLHSLTM